MLLLPDRNGRALFLTTTLHKLPRRLLRRRTWGTEVSLPTNVKGNSKTSAAVPNRIVTAGEIFSDGTMIELVTGSPQLGKPQLLLWNGHKAKIGPQVAHNGQIYEAAEMQASLYRAMRLPARCGTYHSAQRLFDDIGGLFDRYAGLSLTTCGLLAGFSISTWLRTHLANVLHLAMCGWDEELGVDVLRLLHCVCRHPLLIGEMTPAWFRKMPIEIAPTLLLNQQIMRPVLQNLVRASCYRGLRLPGSAGDVVDLYGAKAIFCGDDSVGEAFAGNEIRVRVAHSHSKTASLDEKTVQSIADEFQPRLLAYRLKTLGKTNEVAVDVSRLSPGMQPRAHILASCFPTDAKLAGDAVQLLSPQDEEVRNESALRVDYAIIEVLLGMIHERKLRALQVEELAQYVNSLLQSRGERWAYGHEAIGRLLADMTIERHRNGSGQRVILDRGNSGRVHHHARACGLLSADKVNADCPDCGDVTPPGPNGMM